ncbi:MAG: alkaline shock response membrane anchor protein AmaP [Clostridiales bacterium]|jgi:uncharacterized alkaline shock family protein YloU|nr:alkaline shock response membrane anchor protein AmaP [Clostridiales bacterium]
MKVIDRILLAVLLFALICASIMTVVLEFDILQYEPLSRVFGLDKLMHKLLASLILGAGSLIILFVCVRLFFAVLFPQKKTDADIKRTQIAANELGIAYITIDALKSMAHRICSLHKFVNDCSASVTVVNDGIVVSVKITPIPDTNLPESIVQLQTSLKTNLEQQSGINVVEIPILVLPPAIKKGSTALK